MEEDIEKYTESLIKELCKKWYNKGFRDGKNQAYREANPGKHYCRECRYWNGERSSIGVECTNTNRMQAYKHRQGTVASRFKTGSNVACKTGFEPKEV